MLFFVAFLSSGHLDASMKTAIKLCEYDDILNPRYIYSLLCLAALKNKFFGICSKAFVKVRTQLGSSLFSALYPGPVVSKSDCCP